MRILRTVALAAGVLLALSSINRGEAQEISIIQLCEKIEKGLNTKNPGSFNSIFSNESLVTIKKQYQSFVNLFPNAEWKVVPRKKLKDGRSSVDVLISGTRQKGSHNFFMNSKQTIAFGLKNKKINSHEILNHYSILKNSEQGLSLTINVPETVLTGSNYDFDIIINKPLDKAIAAGGLINISQQQFINFNSPDINLAPMGGGGLFKTIKAPMNPGKQIWAALLVHPDGMVSITKLVRIVSNNE